MYVHRACDFIVKLVFKCVAQMFYVLTMVNNEHQSMMDKVFNVDKVMKLN